MSEKKPIQFRSSERCREDIALIKKEFGTDNRTAVIEVAISYLASSIREGVVQNRVARIRRDDKITLTMLFVGI